MGLYATVGGDSGGDGSAGFAGVDDAVTFSESDVTLAHTNTTVSGGSVGLKPTDESTVTTGSNPSVTTSDTDAKGTVINPNINLNELSVDINSNMGSFTSVFLVDATETIMVEKTGTWSGANTFTFTNLDLQSGTKYYVGVWNDGNSTTYNYHGAEFPYTSQYIDCSSGVYGHHPDDSLGLTENGNNWWVFDTITGRRSYLDGSVAVEWSKPQDLFAWDVAQFQRTLDGETVDIFVDVSDDGGSSWTQVAGPISRGFDLNSVANTSQWVRLRAELVRASTTPTPTLDYIARRFKR